MLRSLDLELTRDIALFLNGPGGTISPPIIKKVADYSDSGRHEVCSFKPADVLDLRSARVLRVVR